MKHQQQSSLESGIETVVNIGSGMILAWCTTQFILAPLFNIPLSGHDNTILTIALTVVSVCRSYLWRRFFARGLHLVVAKLVRGILDCN